MSYRLKEIVAEITKGKLNYPPEKKINCFLFSKKAPGVDSEASKVVALPHPVRSILSGTIKSEQPHWITPL